MLTSSHRLSLGHAVPAPAVQTGVRSGRSSEFHSQLFQCRSGLPLSWGPSQPGIALDRAGGESGSSPDRVETKQLMSPGSVRGDEMVLEQAARGRGDVGGLRAVSGRGARYEKQKRCRLPADQI